MRPLELDDDMSTEITPSISTCPLAQLARGNLLVEIFTLFA